VSVGDRPILWHIMKYYAKFGHTDFVLCLGYKGEVIRDYFLNWVFAGYSGPFFVHPYLKVLSGEDVRGVHRA
jgi:NDP-sugar pyrophosphorylase family protein